MSWGLARQGMQSHARPSRQGLTLANTSCETRGRLVVLLACCSTSSSVHDCKLVQAARCMLLQKDQYVCIQMAAAEEPTCHGPADKLFVSIELHH